jgi:hypothetical protein
MKHTNDIIAMARRAGAHDDGNEVRFVELRYLERFAALVRADERNRAWTQKHWTEYERSIAAAERKACAAIARQWDVDHPASNYGGCIANLIEAREQA